MAVMNIPTDPTLYSYREEVTVDDTPRVFEFHWNYRARCYVLTIRDRDDNVLVGGIKIVLGYTLFEQHPDRQLPKGILIAFDPSGKLTGIVEGMLGSIVFLTFVPEDDLNAAV